MQNTKLKPGTIQTILKLLKIRVYSAGDMNLQIRCPNPSHKDKRPSCYIRKDDGRWQCWSCRSRRDYAGRGNLYSLLKIYGRDDLIKKYCPGIGKEIDIKKLLKDKLESLDQIDSEIVKRRRISLPDQFSRNFRGVLGGKYLKKIKSRGLSKHTIGSFNLGFIHEDDEGHYPDMSRRIVIPIHENKKLIGYQARTVKKNEKRKYLFNKGFDTKINMFNLDNIKGGTAIIVEGVFDCMKLWQWGYESIALFGLYLTPEKVLKLVKKGVKTLIFALDGDDPAREAVKSMYFEVCPFFDDVFVIKLPQNVDVGDMEEEDFFVYLSKRKHIVRRVFPRKMVEKRG